MPRKKKNPEIVFTEFTSQREIYDVIQSHLVSTGMSLKEFSKLAGISRMTVWNFGKGRVNQTHETLFKIIKAINKTGGKASYTPI